MVLGTALGMLDVGGAEGGRKLFPAATPLLGMQGHQRPSSYGVNAVLRVTV